MSYSWKHRGWYFKTQCRLKFFLFLYLSAVPVHDLFPEICKGSTLKKINSIFDAGCLCVFVVSNGGNINPKFKNKLVKHRWLAYFAKFCTLQSTQSVKGAASSGNAALIAVFSSVLCTSNWAEWKCSDLKCVWKPTRSRFSLTHHANKSSRWTE